MKKIIALISLVLVSSCANGWDQDTTENTNQNPIEYQNELIQEEPIELPESSGEPNL